jgi:hypothetical protein
VNAARRAGELREDFAAARWASVISRTIWVWEMEGAGFRAAAAARRSREVVPSALVPVLSAEQTMAVR